MSTFDSSAFHLSFDDEFNSFTSSPNGSTGWQTTYYFGGRSLPSNGEQEYYSDSSVGVNPFSVQNGELTITAAPGSNPEGLAYNSGLITTEGDFTQTYGYFEIRAEVPAGQGMWPGFWMLPADKSWPPEIDALEAFGAPNANGEGGADQVHVNAISHAITDTGNSSGGGEWVTIPGDIYTGYHTYGVDWEPDYIKFYIDGTEVYQVATPSDMNKPMYMLANVAVGGPWVGNATGETGEMKIDYIRAYSKDPNVATITQQPMSSPDGVDTSLHSSAVSDATGTLTLHIAEDAWNGDAQFTALVDGQQIGDTQTATASHANGQWQDITLTGSFGTGPHTIDVNFINDGWGGTAATDRNLYVQSVTINGETISGPAAVDNAASGGASADPSAAVMMVNGTSEFTAHGTTTSPGGSTTIGDTTSSGESTLYLKVSEDAWNGDAQFTVSIDGQQIGGTQTATASHAAGQWQTVALNGDFGTGPHTIDVNFINDGWGGTLALDRNLYVEAISLNGETVLGSHATDTAANGSAAADPTAAVMMINGTSEFKTTGTNISSTSTLTLHVSEDAWNGDAQFIVTVDGHQVGGTETATASHAQGQWQSITLTGDFGLTGPDKIDLTFLNDGWGGSAATDRNLYVQSIGVNGQNFAGNEAINNAANGSAAEDPHSAVMMINGTAEFAVDHSTVPSDFWHLA